jgi:hypothetical protein
MTTPAPDDEGGREIIRRADAFVAHLPETPESFDNDLHQFSLELYELLDAVRATDVHFAFDRDGRPAALKAALPTMERDLLDAVLEDHEAEMAAWKETLYQGLIALRRARL